MQTSTQKKSSKRRSRNFFGVGNVKTKVAHVNSPGDQCRISEILKKNRVYFIEEQDLTDALEGDWRPCKVCAKEYD